jgi:hypothetical protein
MGWAAPAQRPAAPAVGCPARHHRAGLLEGAGPNGFVAKLCILERVAVVIEHLTGVRDRLA